MKLRLVLGTLALAGCVTGGGNPAGVAVGSVVVYSAVAQEAQAGKAAPTGTAALWCGTLRLTQAQRGLWQSEPHTDDQWAETLARPVYEIARDHGYALHRTQTRTLILDAKRVNEDPVALDEALKKCPGPS
jgi:glutamate-1-semialdehyde aminotransferase